MGNRTKWPKSVMSPPERVLTRKLLQGRIFQKKILNGHHMWPTASKRQQLHSCHRLGPKIVPAQTAETTKCHVIFIVFFKLLIEIAGGDGINQFF